MGDRLATIDVGRKVGAAVLLSIEGTGAEAYLRTRWHLDPSNRLTTIHQRYRQDNGPEA